MRTCQENGKFLFFNNSVIPECFYRESRLRMKQYFVYILASKRNGTLYIGVTSNLEKRIFEHKNKLIKGFTEKYNLKILVYYEITNDINSAIRREKQLKKWNRKWKLELIEKSNPKWTDLSEGWISSRACLLQAGWE